MSFHTLLRYPDYYRKKIDIMTVLLTTSGMFKIVESFAVFILLVIHRIGNQGSQVWFGTADFEMNYKNVPSETDAEILGCGTLTAFCIITPVILLSYVMEGRQVVQTTVIDAAFSFIAAALLLTSGGMACFTYNYVFGINGSIAGPHTHPNSNVSRTNMEVAGAMGVLSILTAVVYLIDFFYLIIQRQALREEEYDN